jgi:uncharacterized protein (DUF111 family)
LLQNGALDVWQTPVTGKKGRSAAVLSVLSREDDVERLVDYVLRKSTTFGVRYRTWNRLVLEREMEERDVNGRAVRFKIGRTTTGEVLKEKPEFDDVKDQY